MEIRNIKLVIKKNISYYQLAIIALLTLTNTAYTRDRVIGKDTCMDSRYRTILLHKQGWDLSLPVIAMGTDEQVALHFDYLADNEPSLSYTIVKCRHGWELNDISEHYFLEGFNEVPIRNYQSSRNTSRFYTHYSTVVPNEDVQLLQSGNYLLKVHDAANPGEVFFTRRFALSEERVEIKARVNRPDFVNQELMITVGLGNLDVRNPMEDIKLVIVKNYNWTSKVEITRPPLLRDNTLHYDMPYQIITPGNNEYRDVDLKDVTYIAPRVDSIRYIAPEYHFYLTPDKPTPYAAYFHSKDLNGQYYIDQVGAYNRHTEADYVHVHFTLETGQALGADVYIYGAITNWETSKDNFMIYDTDKGIYTKQLFLKQGMINYLYATREYDKPDVMFDLTEGSHDETENEYHIFVYWTDVMSDFDRLVGYKVVNSKKH